MSKRALDLFASGKIQGGAFISAEDDLKFLFDWQVVLVGGCSAENAFVESCATLLAATVQLVLLFSVVDSQHGLEVCRTDNNMNCCLTDNSNSFPKISRAVHCITKYSGRNDCVG